jgi:hypothetical protein
MSAQEPVTQLEAQPLVPSHSARGLRGTLDLARDAAIQVAQDYRLLTLWTLGMLLPTALAVLPFWRTLASELDRSSRAAELARTFDLIVVQDLINRLAPAGAALGGAALLSMVVALLSWPLLTGMVLTMVSAERRIGFTPLLQGAIAGYWRAARVGLWSIIPLGAAVALGTWASTAADGYAKRAVLESNATLAGRAAVLVTALLLLLVLVSIDAARAELGADPALRKGWRAWLRGLRQLQRQPLSVLALYLVPTLAGLLLATLLLAVRLRVAPVTGIRFVVGLILTQLAVAAIGWGRASRLLALSALARSQRAGG